MLDNKEIELIEELIKQGKSNYKIGKERGLSPNTIKKYREKLKKMEKKQEGKKGNHTKNIEVHFDSPTREIREGVTIFLDNIIKKEQLKAEDRGEWKKRLKHIQEIVRVESDFRITEKITDINEKKDEEWRNTIEQDYVERKYYDDLKNKINEKENTIKNLEKIIDEKNSIIAENNENLNDYKFDIKSKNDLINSLNKQNSELLKDKKDLREDNKYLNNINKRLFEENTKMEIDTNSIK